MPDTLAREIRSRCEAGDIPVWMSSLQEEHGWADHQLADTVSNMVEMASNRATNDEYRSETSDWVEMYGSDPWKALEAFDKLQCFQAYLDESTPTVTIPDVEVFSVGEWNGDEYTEADLRTMVEAFSQVGFEPPLKLGHSEGQKLVQEDGLPSIGWVSDLHALGGKLVATLKGVPRKIAKLIQMGGYKQRSAEVYWNYKDTINGRVWSRVLKALSLIGADVPAVKGMPGLSTLDAYLELYCHGESQEGMVKIAGINFTENTQMGGENTDVTPDAGAIKKMAEELASMKVRMEGLETENKGLKETLDLQATRTQAEAVEYFIATAKKEGKLAPKEEETVRRFAQTLDQSKVHKFSDGEKAVETTQWQLFKDMVMGRESAFVAKTEDRTSDDSKDHESDKSKKTYGQKEFNEEAYTKAYTEALDAGLSQADAYSRAKRVGWGETLPALKASEGGAK